MEDAVTVSREGNIAWVAFEATKNQPAQTFRTGLSAVIDAVADADVAMLLGAEQVFGVTGELKDADQVSDWPLLTDVIRSMEDSPTPFVAVLEGDAMGPGFEIAMGAAWRVAAKSARFGLPQVNIGLIPGAGGSQRAPRLLGMEAAIKMACSGRVFSAAEMLELGGIDRIVEGDLRAEAMKFAQSLPPRPKETRMQKVAALPDDAYLATARALETKARGQKAPLHNLEALQWAALPFDDGEAAEQARFEELRNSAESRALRHMARAEQSVASPAAISEAKPGEYSRIAIVGGGLMGTGIATACLNSGLAVTLIERDAEAARTAQERVAKLVAGALKLGKITQQRHDAQLAAFSPATDYAAAGGADIAIEAVFEDIEVKRDVFAQLDQVMRPDAIFATNTSYLDPVRIFEGVSGPERCLGLHFFSPAHIMKLLEIVRTPATSAEVLATGFDLGLRLGKVSVLAGICDGFIGNRMLAAYRKVAEYLLADGALPYEVDGAMKAFGMPMGVWEVQDLTGLQIAWAARTRQAETRPASERYERISDAICELGRLGRRSGKGWYKYEEGDPTPHRDPEVEAIVRDYSAQNGLTRRTFTPAEISDRILAVLANEGARIVEEGIAENDAAVDVVQVHGYGFPRWRGGPMHYASEIGWDKVTETMRQVAAESPGSWVQADRLSGG